MNHSVRKLAQPGIGRFAAVLLLGLLTSSSAMLAADFNHPAIDAQGDLSIRDSATPFDAVTLPNGDLVVSGQVDYANDVRVHGIAKMSSAGVVDASFDPQFNGGVDCVVVDATHLYICGYFTTVDGFPIAGIARFNLSDMSLDTGFAPYTTPKEITAIAISGTHLYELDSRGSSQTLDFVRKRSLLAPYTLLWETQVTSPDFSDFLRVLPNGDVVTGSTLRKFDAATGARDDNWQPAASPFLYGFDLEVSASGQVLAAGYADDALGRFAPGGAGARDPNWTFAMQPTNAQILAIAPTADDGAIVTGNFTSINGVPTTAGVARINADGSVQVGWGGVDGASFPSMLQVLDGSRFVVGTSGASGGNDVVRAGLLSNGSADDASFTPVPLRTQGAVYGITASGGGVLLHGRFRETAGAGRAGLTKLDAALSVVPDFVPDTMSGMTEFDAVKALVETPSGIYLLTSFFAAALGDLHRQLDATTGARMALNVGITPGSGTPAYNAPPVHDPLTNLMYVAGRWRAGTPSFAVRRFNIATQTLDPTWIPNMGTILTGAEAAALTSLHYYVGGTFTLPAPLVGVRLARMTVAGTGAVDGTWLPNPNGAVYAILADEANAKVYVGGAFATIAGQPRNGLARFDLLTGALDPDWNPLVGSAQNTVRSLALGDDGNLYLTGTLASTSCTPGAKHALRVRANGWVDTGWAVVTDGSLRAAIKRPGGSVLVAGDFDTVGSTAREAFASLATGSDVIFVDHVGDSACVP